MHLPDDITGPLTRPEATPLAVRQEAWLRAKELAGAPIPPHRLDRLAAQDRPAPARVIPITAAHQPEGTRKGFLCLSKLDELLRRKCRGDAPPPEPPRLSGPDAARIRRRNRLCEVMGRTHRPDDGGDAA